MARRHTSSVLLTWNYYARNTEFRLQNMKVECSSVCSFMCLAFGYLNYILCGVLERIVK
jgi:hypothetical protein